MSNDNITPFTGKDGETAPSYSALIAGKTAGGVQQDVLVGSDGKLQVDASVSVSSTGSAIEDGVDDTIKATVKDLTNSNPLTVAIVDTSGDQIASFGGGTQYTEGDTDASITGTAMLWEDTSDTLRPVSAAKPLPVVQTGTPGLPTGAATAANQTTIIGHVDGIETLLTAIDGHVDGIEGSVDGIETLIGTTNSTLTTIDGRVDGIEGLLTTIDADTGNIATSTASIDTKTPALGQALAAASVPVVLTADQIATLTPPAAITGFATSALQTTGNTSLATIAGAVAGTEVQVDVLTMPTTTVQATNLDIRDLVNTDVVTAELSATDNAVLDAIAASVAAIDTDTSTLIGHVDGLEALIGTTNTTLTTIDGRVDGIEALLTTIDADTSNLSVVGGGTEAAAIRVTIANNSTGVLSVDDNGGNISIDDGGNSITVDAPVGTPAFVRLSDGSSAISTLPVSLASVPSHAVTNAGTFPVQVDGSALTALQLIDDPVFADDAGYTLGTSKATIVGGVAVETDGTDPLSVSAEGDAAAFRTDRNRRLLVNKNHPNLWKVNENHSSAQTNNQLKAAPGAGLSFYITDIIISNGATAGTVKLVEDEGGTPVDIAGPFYFAINGGMSSHLETPIRMTANKSLGFTSVTSTTHTVTVMGYTAP